jgi:hypothetical protein
MTTSKKAFGKTELYNWELRLEEDLSTATPAEVLDIMRAINSWLAGYCATCGGYNDLCGGKYYCNCEVK